MSVTLRKRGREPETLLDSIDAGEPKRFHGDETDRFLHLLQLDKTLTDDDEEEYAPSEELVNRVMKSLEEEISATCSTSYHNSNSGNISVADDISSGHEGQTRDSESVDDLFYFLEVSNDELGISPSTVLYSKDEVCQSPKATTDGLSESTDLKSLAENCHFEDNFESYQQFSVYEDAWDANQLEDYMNRDFDSQGMLFDEEILATWRLETAGGM